VDYADYIRENMGIVQESFSDTFARDWAQELLDEEIERVFDMGTDTSRVAAIDLTIRQKCDALQPRDKTVVSLAAWLSHVEIDQYLQDMLDSDGMDKVYINATQLCRRLRTRMSRDPCTATGDQPCIFKALLPALDILQPHAHAEINQAVNNAVAGKLPVELRDLVFEFVLRAEGVDADAAIFVNAVNASGQQRRKARIMCPHMGIWDAADLRVHRQSYVWGPQWTEVE
jgi:hypothetical protein